MGLLYYRANHQAVLGTSTCDMGDDRERRGRNRRSYSVQAREHDTNPLEPSGAVRSAVFEAQGNLVQQGSGNTLHSQVTHHYHYSRGRRGRSSKSSRVSCPVDDQTHAAMELKDTRVCQGSTQRKYRLFTLPFYYKASVIDNHTVLLPN